MILSADPRKRPGACILIVEDNATDAALVQATLARSSLASLPTHHVERVADANAACAPTCVLLDLGLPDMQGVDCVEAMVATFPDVPVVVLTGNSDEATAIAALAAGAQDYLIKGHFDAETLARTIRYAIERKRAQLELDAERRLTNTVLDSLGAYVVVLDEHGVVTYVGGGMHPGDDALAPAIARPVPGVAYLGLIDAVARRGGSEVPLERFRIFLSGDRAPFEFEYEHDDRWFLVRVAPLGEGNGTVVVYVPITQQKALQRELEQLATHDPLTGLQNRAALLEKLDLLLQQRRPPDLAIAFVDLDGFKDVNDRFGHAAGDQILCEVARRLRGETRAGDVVARIGGDEFLIVAHVADRSGAAAFGRRISRCLSAPRHAHGDAKGIGASIGVAHIDSRAVVSSSEAIAIADRAMYCAKVRREGRVVVSGACGASDRVADGRAPRLEPLTVV